MAKLTAGDGSRDSISDIQSLHYLPFFSIPPPPGLLPVLGLLTQYMTPALDTALLCSQCS